MLHFLQKDELITDNDKKHSISSYIAELKSERLDVLISGHTGTISTSTLLYVHYNDTKIYIKNSKVYIATKKFGDEARSFSAPIEIADKGEFFNYVLENDVDCLKFEDLDTVRSILDVLSEKRSNLFKKT
ncbi:hypothetical protein XaC1_463 [Xanthomonas phage XaC1]|nr:hypothetical protein XaC1_463 [Xanthomonas phage XaC1]